MKAIVVVTAVLLVGALRPDTANAWASANRWGGSTSHTWGSTSHTNAWGGSTSHAYGEGTEHTNMYGGNTAHAWGGGTEHTNVYGGSTYGAYGAGATHTYASGASVYHPPGYGGYRRVSRVSSAGCGAVLLGVGLLWLRGRCRRRRWRDRRGCCRCGRGQRGLRAASLCTARRAGGVCKFTGRLHLPDPASRIRMRGNLVRPRLWSERCLLPGGSPAVTPGRQH